MTNDAHQPSGGCLYLFFHFEVPIFQMFFILPLDFIREYFLECSEGDKFTD